MYAIRSYYGKMNTSQDKPSFDAKSFLKTAPSGPGVYRMLNEAQEILYVGKAKIIKYLLKSFKARNHFV